jgi:hypothetical protein
MDRCSQTCLGKLLTALFHFLIELFMLKLLKQIDLYHMGIVDLNPYIMGLLVRLLSPVLMVSSMLQVTCNSWISCMP